MTLEELKAMNKAAKAVSNFLTAQGSDACEDKPNEYFAVMDKALGRMPTQEEVWKIEELRKKGQRRDVTETFTVTPIKASEVARKRELRLAIVQLITIGLGGVVVLALFFIITVAGLL